MAAKLAEPGEMSVSADYHITAVLILISDGRHFILVNNIVASKRDKQRRH